MSTIGNMSDEEFDRGLDEYLEDQRMQYLQSQLGFEGELPEGPCCVGCGKTPDQLPEYVQMADPDSQGYEGFKSADEAVRRNEGTYNRENGHFWCTSCYIKVGMPLGVAP